MVRAHPDTVDADSKSARTRRRILDAAAEVLAARGYAGTRLADVATKADVQAPALYYYFASREDLVEEVVHSGIVQLREHLLAALDALPDGTSPLERLSIAVEEHLRHLLDPSTYATAAIRNAGQVPEGIRARHEVERHAYGEVWAHLLRAAHDAGELRGDIDLRLAQALVLGALNQVGETSDPQRADVEALVANTRSFVLHGLT